MTIELETRPQNSQLDSSDQIFSIDREQVEKLNELFWKVESSKSFKSVAVSGATLGVSGAVLTQTQPAHAADAAATIAEGVASAIAMIDAIDGIGIAAFSVALAPMGFMLTLRVLNMVLSRV